ncbi:MAG: hypothetical protein KF819_01045 [Labilithrix sp.]|nr:hypothetical protein [Labilithrix sp.]
MQKLARVILFCAALGPFAACHARAADPPRAITPTVDVEIEDRAADKSVRTTRFALVLVDGRAKVATDDSDAKYSVEAHALREAEPSFALKLARHAHDHSGEIAVDASIPQRAGPRVLVAKIDRADGRTTVVSAQVH